MTKKTKPTAKAEKWEEELSLMATITSVMHLSSPMEVYPIGVVRGFIRLKLEQAKREMVEEILKEAEKDKWWIGIRNGVEEFDSASFLNWLSSKT